MSNPVVVGVNDLFFSAKITGPANVLGVPMKCFPSCDRLLAAAREAGAQRPDTPFHGRRVMGEIVDDDHAGFLASNFLPPLDTPRLTQRLASVSATSRVQVTCV